MRLSVHLDLVYEVEDTLLDPKNEAAAAAFVQHLMACGRNLGDNFEDVEEGGYRMEPVGWRIEVEGYLDVSVGTSASEEAS